MEYQLNKEHLNLEFDRMKDELNNLDSLINSNKFVKIEPKQQNLLYQQFDAMSKYLLVLEQRIKLL